MSDPSRCPSCDEPVQRDDRFCEACGERRPDPRDRIELSAPGTAAVSDRGRRHRHNEDAVAIRSSGSGDRETVRLAVVCDGVSRGARPDLASRAAVDAALAVFDRTVCGSGATGPADAEEATRQAVRAAGDSVALLSARAGTESPPACTFTSVVLVGRRATVASVGDSRVYWLPRTGPGARPLTVDDSWRREIVATGTMDESAAAADPRRHAITAWLGADGDPVTPHVTTEDLAAPGVLLACTDGLWNSMVDADDLATLVDGSAVDLLAMTRHLVGAALERDGHDNVTAAVLAVPDGPDTDLDRREDP